MLKRRIRDSITLKDKLTDILFDNVTISKYTIEMQMYYISTTNNKTHKKMPHYTIGTTL